MQHRQDAEHLVEEGSGLVESPFFQIKIAVVDGGNSQAVAVKADADVRKLLLFAEVEGVRQEEIGPQLLDPQRFGMGVHTHSKSLRIQQLRAYFLLADALDLCKKQKLSDISIRFDGDRLTITTVYDGNLYLEKRAFDKAAALFYEVFGVLPVLHVKTALLK